MDHFGRTLAFSSLATIAACGLALLWLLPETRRVVGALASAAQTAPSLNSERKRSRLSATGMLEWIPLDRSAAPPSQQHSCSFPPTEAVQSLTAGGSFAMVAAKQGSSQRQFILGAIRYPVDSTRELTARMLAATCGRPGRLPAAELSSGGVQRVGLTAEEDRLSFRRNSHTFCCHN